VQAQAEGKKEDRCKHRRKAGRRTGASTGYRQEVGAGGDLQVCSHVASGLTHNSLPWHLGVVL